MPTDETGFYVIDRVEEGQAMLLSDSGEEHDVSLTELPSGTWESAVLRVEHDGNGSPMWNSARIDEAETARRKREAMDILKHLRRRDPGGDVSL